MTSAEQFAPEISNYYYDQQQQQQQQQHQQPSNPRLTTGSNSATAPAPPSGPSYYPNSQYSVPDSGQHGPVSTFILFEACCFIPR
ncbi:unnamed protein product [Litomosoides sigmodontis]|uniref:Uncharacterized protein n=1 Tax=Litomosoides sigmodontis TaxID=42156 RepID=A0A3P6T8U3_LITSI|nr:unnamed protein product [Litomosoides sigmodontis]